ncbi:UPF0147 family protein [Candidatus Woesearchaeota archaeon]|nr:UPF0147 family protein [Candidatus Woesearchaeota archaeon]
MTDTKEKDLQNVIIVLSELKEDTTVPRNIKNKLDVILGILNEKGDLFLRINKALNELDEISNDNNIQPYTRTQIWNIVSMLESI